METNKLRRILILGVCLFFVLGLFWGAKAGRLADADFLYKEFLVKLEQGYEMHFLGTFAKEFKYIIFVWTARFLIKKKFCIMIPVFIKGFFIGFAAKIFILTCGIKGIFIYILPCQIFVLGALFISLAAFIYGYKENIDRIHYIKFIFFNVFLILLGTAAQFVILKII